MAIFVAKGRSRSAGGVCASAFGASVSNAPPVKPVKKVRLSHPSMAAVGRKIAAGYGRKRGELRAVSFSFTLFLEIANRPLSLIRHKQHNQKRVYPVGQVSCSR